MMNKDVAQAGTNTRLNDQAIDFRAYIDGRPAPGLNIERILFH